MNASDLQVSFVEMSARISLCPKAENSDMSSSAPGAFLCANSYDFG